MTRRFERSVWLLCAEIDAEALACRWKVDPTWLIHKIKSLSRQGTGNRTIIDVSLNNPELALNALKRKLEIE